MSDLTTLRRILGKVARAPMSDWKLRDSDHPDECHVIVLGCPDGQGAYLQVTFDYRGAAIDAEIIDANGETCRCKYCSSLGRER